MICEFCNRNVPVRTKVSIYGEGIWVCGDCYELIRRHRHKPYSTVMDKVAMLETGYHANRKLARINSR
jgi:ribosome-binding protein aMBF1 (putative translation factor)